MIREYPRLEVNTAHFRENAKQVLSRCEKAGISVAAVTKGYSSLTELCRIVKEEGAAQIGTSRLEQVERCRAAGIPGPYLLLRIPSLSELEYLPGLCEYSLESDLETVIRLNDICARQGITHKVIMMMDLGDLREGFWDKDAGVEACKSVESMAHIELAGIGTNLGCYGAIEPTPEKMNELVELAKKIESEIGRKLEFVSGGATSSFVLVHKGQMPEGINHLRIGEAIEQPLVLVNEWGIKDMDYLSTEVFKLKAQVIEVYDKPSHPVGKICIDAFGNVPKYNDRGIRKRALLGVGKADFGAANAPICRLEGAELLGGASDHTILDVQNCSPIPKVGDIVEFDLPYSNILYLSARKDIPVRFVE